MNNKYAPLLLILLVFQSACSVEWTKAIRSGNIAQNEFSETVSIEVQNGLIFIPVSIDGKKYKFLFDTGAPLSISEQLQEALQFKIISQSNILDSDKNRQKVQWAQINSIQIGQISFDQQTAFVGDFEANPLLKCLQIDGIIGSNLIRQANWTIDQKKNIITFSDQVSAFDRQEIVSIPFKTDSQFNMFIDLKIGSAKVKNVLVDYGSNGTVALEKDIFSVLQERNIIGKTVIERGTKQSGIVGKAIPINRVITYSDSIRMGQFSPHNLMIRTGTTTSLGNGLASHFKVTIDWSQQELHFSALDGNTEPISLAGLRLGYSDEKGIYVQAVIEQSNAYKQGIRPGMKVSKIDQLDFENGDDFCDYASHHIGDNIYLQLTDDEGKKKDYRFKKTLF